MSSTSIRLGSGHMQPPRNVEQITAVAQDYEYDANVPLRNWLRTADTLIKEADIYSREGDDETTYFLLFRHAHLILANVAQHPGAWNAHAKEQISRANIEVDKNLKTLEKLKDRINERHRKYTQQLHDRELRHKAQVKQAIEDASQAERQFHPDARRQLQAHEHTEFAAKLAQKELDRRSTVKHAQSSSAGLGDDTSRRLQAIRARVEPQTYQPTYAVTRPPQPPKGTSGYAYPKIPSHQTQTSTGLDSFQSKPPLLYQQDTLSPPALPPKPFSQDEQVPQRPGKVLAQPPRPVTPQTDHVFAPSAYLENGQPLRTIFLPPTLRTTFLRLAYKNTQANLETCGFLAGTLIRNAFFISKLIVPSQTATSDTCEMTNESQLFDYVDNEDLMILGWIHTHPTQTNFMSSRDLHTHSGYQMMLAESIAIVCAPSKGDTTHGGDWGAYRLTDPPGKKAILSCEMPGIFHPHEVDNVYTDAMKPGHVVEVQGMDFQVVDLR